MTTDACSILIRAVKFAAKNNPLYSAIYNRGFKQGYVEAMACINETRSTPRLAAIKNLHKGRRGFVIGNGPSLNMRDLTKLKNEVTIAANKIYLSFSETEWRPQYVTVCDSLVWKKIKHSLHNHYDTVFVPSTFDTTECLADCISYRYLGNSVKADGSANSDAFSTDLAIGAYGGYSVTYDNLQLAVHLGLNPIYLLGCDHYYAGETCKTPDVPVSANSINHFSSEYRTAGEQVNPAPINLMTTAYAIASEFTSKHGVSIVNATRGGHLDVFERADLDAVLGG